MSIDPRTLKSLLQAQLAPSLNFGTATKKAASQSEDVASLFETILSGQLGGDNGEISTDAGSGALPPVWSDRLWAQVIAYDPLDGSALADAPELSGSHTFSGAAAPFAGIIASASAKYGVDSALIEAVIATESGFRPLAESHAGAKGLMQLMDGTARGLGVSDSFDPVQNIEGGTRYLSLLLRKYGGNEAVALAAYNAGPGRIDRLGISTDEELLARLGELPEETQRYVAKVQQAKQ
ncbi:lytic transglycosylase domain-containing protein [Paenibacillus sp. LHD-117]|uniref:lytic transglycosylase domain-containing protein n=1 Tax=Paenibacillus sp. LHD-117 TaxID=3071412 RepID=UPI0027E0F1C8|nr:lytic transglycosylase domain-containing protein [Paenibacillus sp. LHD-117]MDQ6418998.1 lytic transglycosylase domain-containing protein [Paenibacillus sp. LHD-117]